MDRVTVLIVDDQPLVRQGLRVLIDNADGLRVVGEAASGNEAIDAAGRLHPDVVLMDVRMPDGDGLTATRTLSRPGAPGPVPVVVLTTYDTDDYVFGALEAGAAGFLLKDAPVADIIAAIRVAASGDGLVSPSVTRRVIAEFARRGPRHGAAPAGAVKAVDAGAAAMMLTVLTPREADIVRALSEGLNNSEIAKRLHLDVGTVRNHLSRVMTKLGLQTRTQVVVWAFRSGMDR
ncbi:response regulator [Gryllotalpicola reticulitermitis]|uniref:Response regulator n=1 Tax=Gryllotalpicola reticulitermitis TaxID=1184153 RepID=A0ABV8QDZ9_9MICO